MRHEISEIEYLWQEIEEAKIQLRIAEDNFNNCSPEWFELANKELTIRKDYLDLLWMKSKKFADAKLSFVSPIYKMSY